MLARIVKPSATAVVKRALTANNVRMIDSRRFKSHGGEVQHGHHGEVEHHGHHDNYQTMYERLWQHKATLDWLPKPEGNWEEINGKTQAYYNKVLGGGIIAFTLAVIYFRVIVIGESGALTSPPYHLIGKEDFPGSKYQDAVGETKK
ncbi:unnamed protein product [Rotaria socialis]|uniref:Deltamethrin resistance protein prag01 domain-containing protein n=1 Tax=Rotaria socialis TaxID=392032 RepID=A0A821EKD9_9BILA|nr:unnamed protein product [Rotaria socialis]CAF3595382.1 unnamed protein product [Rotaria socialis]CAF3649673.1 unnamed protein product [Rotaria socialis]CAF4191421.1 unnamed protein product [Rotaria socialis]CAF4384089.1 unnamed protein product [Rotaria socialis]